MKSSAIPSSSPLSEHTTFRVGGRPSGGLWSASTEEDLIDALRAADADEQDVLLLGGGSNLLVADEGFAGVAIRDERQRIDLDADSTCAGGIFRVTGGTNWDDFVRRAIAEEYMGVEALSGIPGAVGAAPVQNVGAYGQEVAETISSLRVWDRQEQRIAQLPLARLKFGYRTSILKQSRTQQRPGSGGTWGATGRWVVLEVEFQMRAASLSAPVRYGELARRLDVAVEDRVRASQVREAVLELRAGKGMVLDSSDQDTWSAGSFFTNPIIDVETAEGLPQDAPRFPVTDSAKRTNLTEPPPVVEGVVKTSAAWLIDNAGFTKGFSVPGSEGRASLSTKHVLALTNRGRANAADILTLARTVREGVRERYGITLEPEPVVLGAQV